MCRPVVFDAGADGWGSDPAERTVTRVECSESGPSWGAAQTAGRVPVHGARAARRWGIPVGPPLRVRSARGMVPVRAAAQVLLHEADHVNRLACRAGDGFEVAVEMEQGQSRFFRGGGDQEIDRARAAMLPLGGELFLDDAGSAVDTVRHGAPGVVGVECSLQAGAVRR